MLDTDLLSNLLTIDSPTGDEYRMADWLTRWIENRLPSCKLVRVRDCLIAIKGAQPRVAVFAHIDTIGYTVAPDFAVYPIGHPAAPTDGAQVRLIGSEFEHCGTLSKRSAGEWEVKGLDCKPGDRIVSAVPPKIDTVSDTITSPCLDNRGGVYAALQTLLSAKEIAVAFTSGEETGGSGARICARHLWDEYNISQALVADITWDTDYVHVGSGVAISRRDAMIPSQRFVDAALALAAQSGIRYQVEIESSGSSDGAGIEESGCPIEWVFVGAPEKRPHTPTEELRLSDLDSMSLMLPYLVDALRK